MTKIWRGRQIYLLPTPHPYPGIGLKRHTFNIKQYLHKKFVLAYIRITKLLKKKYFEKFIEELDFVERLNKPNIWGREYHTTTD